MYKLLQKKLNCLRDCNGACCHDMTIKALGEQEMAIIEGLKQQGANLQPLEVYDNFPAGTYLMVGNCPARNAGKNRRGCANYGKDRLRSCRANTQCGDKESCLLFREREGYKI